MHGESHTFQTIGGTELSPVSPGEVGGPCVGVGGVGVGVWLGDGGVGPGGTGPGGGGLGGWFSKIFTAISSASAAMSNTNPKLAA